VRRIGWMAPLALLLASGCGQPKQPVVVEKELPPMDFAIRPSSTPLEFAVEGGQVMEVMGTGMEHSFRFRWTAGGWREEGDSARTAEVRFSKVEAFERRGEMATPEPMKIYEQLEGFSTRHRLDAEGFSPVAEPARTAEFMQAFAVLEQGLSPLDWRSPGRAIAPGESWTEVLAPDELGPMADVAGDSTITLTYTGNVQYKGRDCARVEAKMTIPLLGEMQQGPAKSRVEGSIESGGAGLYDPELGFFVFWRSTSSMKIRGTDYDEKGEQLGGEKSFSQSGHLEITYLGL